MLAATWKQAGECQATSSFSAWAMPTLSHGCGSRGPGVLGGGDPGARAVPLGPILDALVSADDPPVAVARLHELSRSPDQRLWLLRELQESLEKAAQRTPLLFIVDDLQWADAATAALVTLSSDMLGGEPDEALRQALRRADGQPFLLTELLRGLRAENVVAVDGGTAKLTSSSTSRRTRRSRPPPSPNGRTASSSRYSRWPRHHLRRPHRRAGLAGRRCG
jgi:hypothetical protein